MCQRGGEKKDLLREGELLGERVEDTCGIHNGEIGCIEFGGCSVEGCLFLFKEEGEFRIRSRFSGGFCLCLCVLLLLLRQLLFCGRGRKG